MDIRNTTGIGKAVNNNFVRRLSPNSEQSAPYFFNFGLVIRHVVSVLRPAYSLIFKIKKTNIESFSKTKMLKKKKLFHLIE